ncbi:MAG: hypothetical protein ITG02_06030 [Patulibacter sp.]|nr:hypothetical protein [Patulibacter sp.]
MSLDLAAAERFVLTNGRLIERHRLAVLLHGGSADRVLATLRAYRNPDGGFGHALEPDLRASHSEPLAVQAALDVLAEVGALQDPMVADATTWIASIALPDGGVPFALPAAADAPHAPWIQPTAAPSGSHLTFALAGLAHRARWSYGAGTEPQRWIERADAWCWERLEHPDRLGAYDVKFALEFLDAVSDDDRAATAIDRIGALIRDDGTLPVAGGTADEQLTALQLSPDPGARSRALFPAAAVERELDRLEADQQSDGGWTFDWGVWSPAQEVEWRGRVTLAALATLIAHGRLTVD